MIQYLHCLTTPGQQPGTLARLLEAIRCWTGFTHRRDALIIPATNTQPEVRRDLIVVRFDTKQLDHRRAHGMACGLGYLTHVADVGDIDPDYLDQQEPDPS